MTLILSACILLFLLASAFCSLSEVAFFSLPASRIRAYRHSQLPRKRQIARLLAQSRELLVTIFLLNTIVNIFVQNISSDLFDRLGESWLFKVGVPLVLVLIFGELLPKYMGLVYNEQVATFSAPFYEWFQRVTAHIRHYIVHIANFFSRLFFFGMKVEKPLSQAELEHLFETSEDLGIIHKEEVHLLEEVLSLDSRFAKDLMIPRNIMTSYDIEEPLSKLLFYFKEQNLTEVALCRESLDNFIGMVRAIDVLLMEPDT